MSKRYFILSVCLSFLLALALPAMAQNTRTVTGTVVDELGEPVIGATIMVMGTTTGTVTDIDGKFSLAVPENGKLTVSFIGYTTQTITNLNNPNIILKEDVAKLDEVVVVGYGTQKMKNVTGAIETISPDEIKDLSVGSLSAALGGLVNGLSSSGGWGRPGEAASLQIRQGGISVKGANAKNGEYNTSPLYVIDDFVSTEEAFNNLDVSEVESVTVLKDASAAVYGARASQGVVLVKTKRGKIGTPKISYTGQFGYTDALAHPKMLSGYNQARLWNAVRAAQTSSDSSEDMDQLLYQSDELEAIKGMNYDLLDKEWSAALTQRHSVNINGGTEKATYFAGVSYYQQDGNIGRLDYDRWNFRAGVNANISKWLKASLQVSGDYGEMNKAKNGISGGGTDIDYNTLLTHPRYIPDYLNGFPIVGTDMENNDPSGRQLYNFASVQNSPDNIQNQSQNTTFNSSIEYDFGWNKILQGLKVKLSYSKNISTNKGNEVGTNITVYKLANRGGSAGHLYSGDNLTDSDFMPLTMNNGNAIGRSSDRTDNYQANLTLSYARQFGLHNVSGLFSIERAESETETLVGRITDPTDFTDGQDGSAFGEHSTQFGRSESGMLSYVGRLNYSYADKYLFEFLIRSDASTKFAPSNYWGTFPSASAGWVISEENWFNKEKLGIDFLKVRASFGMLGKDNIAPWSWTQLYSPSAGKGAIFGTGDKTHVNVGTGLGDAPNPYAHWDKSYKFNLGFDFRFLESRLSATLDAYYDMNREMFMSRTGSESYPATVGTQATAENFGEVDTWGVELSLGWRDKIGKDFKYNVKVNLGYSDNKVKKMAWPTLFELDGVLPNHRADTGVWGLECLGMFRSYQEIQEYFNQYGITNYFGKGIEDVHPGTLIYRDVRGDQNADGTWGAPDGKINNNDYIKISNRKSNPYGFTVNFGCQYKAFSLSTQLNASWGAYAILPKYSYTLADYNSSNFDYKQLQYRNMPSFWNPDNMFVYEDVLDANSNVTVKQNLDAKYPNLRYADINSQPSTFWKVNAARITVRNITLAYSLPKEWMNKVGVESCRLNLTCQNVFSFYNPYPDNYWDSWAGTYGNYPNLRKFTLGVNVSF